jgi:hypothetical protein
VTGGSSGPGPSTAARPGLRGRYDELRENWLTLRIATVLIALEFKHSIVKVVAARRAIVQVRTVLLIAVLALARKFVILDAQEYPPATVLSLAAALVGLGLAYWLVRESDARAAERRQASGRSDGRWTAPQLSASALIVNLH